MSNDKLREALENARNVLELYAPNHGVLGEIDDAIAATQQAAPSQVPKARWCDHCGEGVALFCRDENSAKCQLNLPQYRPKREGLQFASQVLESGTVDGLTFVQRETALKAVSAALLEASAQREQPAASNQSANELLGAKMRKLCDGGAFDLTDSPKSMLDTVVRLCAETANSKPEPQAQAREPKVVAFGVRFANTGKWNSVFVVGMDDEEISDYNPDLLLPLITLQSHREAMAFATNQAASAQYILDVALDAITKKDAALKAEASSRGMFISRLENMNSNGYEHLTVEVVLGLLNDCDMLANIEADAAITQGQEALK